MSARRRARGWTVLELLVVLAALTVVAVLILVGRASAKRRARLEAVRDHVTGLETVLVAPTSPGEPSPSGTLEPPVAPRAPRVPKGRARAPRASHVTVAPREPAPTGEPADDDAAPEDMGPVPANPAAPEPDPGADSTMDDGLRFVPATPEQIFGQDAGPATAGDDSDEAKDGRSGP